MKKYFITWDIERTLTLGVDFLSQNFTEIRKDFRKDLIDIVNKSFEQNVVEFVSYDSICGFFQQLKKQWEFVISLEDWIYIEDANFYFSSTRTYKNRDSILSNPNNYEILQRNWEKLWYQTKDLIIPSWKEIVICDDWLFSWDTLKKVVENLFYNWVDIKEIRVILNFTWLDNLDWIPIKSMYRENSCIDWLDERDLFYWTKNWWASFFYLNNLNGLPYISNSQIANKKASIPKYNSKSFCKNMISLNRDIWQEIRYISSRIIRLINLPRIKYLSESYDINISISRLLELEKNNI